MPRGNEAESAHANKTSQINQLDRIIDPNLDLPPLQRERRALVTILQRFPGFFGPGGFASSCSVFSAANGGSSGSSATTGGSKTESGLPGKGSMGRKPATGATRPRPL